MFSFCFLSVFFLFCLLSFLSCLFFAFRFSGRPVCLAYLPSSLRGLLQGRCRVGVFLVESIWRKTHAVTNFAENQNAAASPTLAASPSLPTAGPARGPAKVHGGLQGRRGRVVGGDAGALGRAGGGRGGRQAEGRPSPRRAGSRGYPTAGAGQLQGRRPLTLWCFFLAAV